MFIKNNTVIDETTSYISSDKLIIKVEQSGIYYPTYGIKGSELKPNTRYTVEFEMISSKTRDNVIAVLHGDSFITPEAIILNRDEKTVISGITKNTIGEWGIHIMIQTESSSGREEVAMRIDATDSFNMYYNKILDMLPYELKNDGNATNIKKFFRIYADIFGVGDDLNDKYGLVLDIYNASAEELDFIGNTYAVYRKIGENDDDYRNNIIAEIIKRKTPTTLPQLQQAISSITSSGDIGIYENFNGLPANVYITGTADEQSIKRAIALIKVFLPAGVRAIIPIVAFDTWGDVKDRFEYWESIISEGFIW